MSIDALVPLVARVVAEDADAVDGAFVSHRHAEELHVLGLRHEFGIAAAWSRVGVNVMFNTVSTPSIVVQIQWGRVKEEYPAKLECEARKYPLSETGVQALLAEWPRIRRQFERAVARGRPPAGVLSPQEKWGDDFACQQYTGCKADGTERVRHEIAVRIHPQADEASTLKHGWAVLRELAQWTAENFTDRPRDELYRLTIAWSRHVRPEGGDIFRVNLDRAKLAEVAGFARPAMCAERFGGGGWLPRAGWQREVFSGADAKAGKPGARADAPEATP